jgi:hypothetical protein
LTGDDPFLAQIPQGLMYFQQGYLDFCSGHFWDSHESWEQIWKHPACRGAFKLGMQCLIQTAACAVLLEQGRFNGFQRKQSQCLDKLAKIQNLGVQSVGFISLACIEKIHTIMQEQDSDWAVNIQACLRETCGGSHVS